MATTETKRKRKYEPRAKTKGGALTKSRRLECIDKIQDTYLRYGTINKSELSRELNINRGTMVTLINEMNIEIEALPAIKLELKLIFERIKNRLMFLWDKLIEQSKSDYKINIRAELSIMKEIKDTINNFYSMLQEFGEAPKQADKVEVKGLIAHVELDLSKESESILNAINNK